MSDPTINVFAAEFDRYHDLLVQQIDLCPSEEEWRRKIGRFPYWWHLLHAFAIVELYALPAGSPSRQIWQPEEVVYAKAEPTSVMTREEMRALAASMKTLAHEFFAAQSRNTLMEKNEKLSARYGRETFTLNALIGFLRHYNYHIGCLDSHLRSLGIPGLL